MLPALLLLTTVVSSVMSWTSPWFCHNNECPKFTISENHTEYQKRHYEPSVWVSTKFDNIRYDRSVNSAMFFKLFHYIDSGNNKGIKIPMTSPVLTEHVLLPGGKANVTMNFMIPFNLQTSTPLPTDSTLFITRKGAIDAYVLSYPGFSNEKLRDSELHQLRADLIRDGTNSNYDTTRYYEAGYDSPFTFTHRHNEIWLLALS